MSTKEEVTKPQEAASDATASMPIDRAEEIWFREDERWELTWPIWHMLPRHERKALAFKYGYKTIGEFEEYMSLQRGITDSAEVQPYANNLLYPEYPDAAAQGKHAEEKPHAILVAPEDDEDSADANLEEAIRSEQEAAVERITTEELMKVGGNILMLPDELLHKVFSWLPVDTYAALSLVSPHWKAFTRTEAVYRRLCERLYLNQSKRRALHVHRFNNSYRTMLERRPRIRAGGGVYVMKYSQVKPVQRDMWTEVRLFPLLGVEN
jgi:F-box protein 9